MRQNVPPVAERVGEIQVERDQSPTACDARLVDDFFSGATEVLGAHCIHIVPALGEEWDESDIEVFIQLELQDSEGSSGMGMIRSRVISAAYAKAARMSSMVN